MPSVFLIDSFCE